METGGTRYHRFMPPLLLADWRQIERVFCAVCWIAAVALLVVIVGLATNPSSVRAIGRQAQAAPATGVALPDQRR